MQVSASARVRSKEACGTLAEHMKSCSEELHSSAACVGVDGKIKLPKRKKILTPEPECDKLVVAQFKRPEPQ